jgi:MFS family permease
MFAGAGFLGVLFVTPLFLQNGQGASALTSGLTTFPEAVGVVLSTQIVARLYPSIGPRRLMAGGLTGVAIVIACLSLIQHDTNLWLMRALMFLIGAGMAYAFLPLQACAFATISSTATGRASALYSAQRQVGFALGVAILSSVLSLVGPTYLSVNGTMQPNLTAYHAAFLTAALLSLIGAGIALGISDRDAAITMQQRARKTGTGSLPESAYSAEASS